ncbi:MAG: N-6 DNA methylase [Gammaproteobacteria bacterium]|nr:N-6 DNA methylase [Gammaproteobacteria bacterium]
MPAANPKLIAAVEAFFAEVRRIRQSGAGTGELSSYPALVNLFNAVGASLTPRVRCIASPKDEGAGLPDMSLFAEKRAAKRRPPEGRGADRGVVEVKAPEEDMKSPAVRDQASRYWRHYRLVLLTNLREFELLGQGGNGEETALETFRLAESAEALYLAVEKPRAFARATGPGLVEYLRRALSHKAALAEPKDLAELLASYARDGLARVEQAGDAPALEDIRSALEEALGVSFEGQRGDHFFRSTLVQTLFYGVFSAWVLWTRSNPPADAAFRWQNAVWHLRAPVLQALFHQLANPMRLQPLGLVEVLDWTGAALNRVDRPEFFKRFDQGEAVPYFYEPFLEAFDPELRKQLGVWYTPSEVVQYMVARVDRALKDDLGIADGLAADNVYILDPCCGTGAYLAEVLRRIAEKTGQGVVCFISNYSWLDGLSFTGMRECYLEAFDAIRIDCLNGDKYKTGKVAPDGSPDPSIFSTESDPVGIQVGTAIATLVRKGERAAGEPGKPPARLADGAAPNHHNQFASSRPIAFRHLWGQAKRETLAATAECSAESLYEDNDPVLPLGLPFLPTAVSDEWFDWPSLPELFPASFPSVKTSRDSFLVDIDRNRLEARITDYFNKNLTHEEIGRRYPTVMKTTARFDAAKVRDGLLARGRMDGAPSIESGIIRFAYRPFDNRWLYWERDTKLLDEKRSDYKPHVFDGNLWIVAQKKPRRAWSRPQVISSMGCLDLMDRGATCIPCWLHDDGMRTADGMPDRRANLSAAAEKYIAAAGVSVEDLFHHALAVLHDPAYREANAGALRMEWPRIPLPGWPAPDNASARARSEAAQILAQSAARGRQIARLLDPETPVPGITQGPLRPEIAAIAVPATANASNMAGSDYAITAGWGHHGAAQAVMPGQGQLTEREYTPEERAALADAVPTLGDSTFDIHLNNRAFWRNVPAAVWHYKLGGYQVLKKYLSYREQAILNRPLTPEEAHHFTQTARRIAALLLLSD